MSVLIVAAFVALSSFVLAQSGKSSPAPRNVDLCELIRHPQNYGGRMVRVRGRVNFEFEDFSLDDSECPKEPALKREFGGVWLTFGGDQTEIAVFCCGGHARKKGSDLEIGDHKVGLVRDRNFYRFLNAIQAHRLRRPDGKACYAECKLYKVSATIVGLFSAATDQRGYGHFGWFHLLAMQQFDEIEAARTPVPFGGTFTCKTDRWEPEAEERNSIADSLACKNIALEACTPEAEFGLVAAHWNASARDLLSIERMDDVDGTFVDDAISSDLLTTYSTQTNTSGEVSILREHCQPDPAHVPQFESGSIACKEYHVPSDGEDPDIDRLLQESDYKAAWALTAKHAEQLYTQGDQSWRGQEANLSAWHVLRQQAEQWHLPLDAGLTLNECQDHSMDGTPTLINCSWHSPDGTQSFDVGLLKERRPGFDQAKLPWLVSQVNGEVCRPVTE